jgi:hypothetical protein
MAMAARWKIIKAVVDTEPLLNALLLNYVATMIASRREAALDRSRISWYLKDRAMRPPFLELFGGIQKILTTSHVIGEVNGLSPKGEDREEFWRSAMRWLEAKRLDERFVQLLDMQAHQATYQIGPADAELVMLAQGEGCHLLTDDRRTLAPHAWKQGVNCIVLEEYLIR